MSNPSSTVALERLLWPIARHWWLWVLFGVLSIAAGVIALANPGLSLLAIALLFGCALIVIAFFDLLSGLQAETGDTFRRVAAVLLGVLALIAGIICLRRPGASLIPLVLVVGTYLIVAGALQFASAPGDADAAPHVVLGGFDVVLGILILAVPGLSLVLFAVLFGIGLVVRGAMAIVVGLRLRRVGASRAPGTRAAPAA
jgi:uncharacterized membrane protein HdeD (DUF308 family)